MTPELAIHVIRQAFLAALWLSAPLLVLGFIIGVVVNLVQVATSMQDSAFSTVPRLAAFLCGFLLLLPWMLRYMVTYATAVLADLGQYAQ